MLNKSELLVLPTPLHPKDLSELSPKTLNAYKSVDLFVVERANRIEQLLRKINAKITLKNYEVIEYNQKLNRKHKIQVKETVKKELLKGKKIAVLSEVGLPNVADPGKDIIAIAHSFDVKVQAIGGASAICLGLAGSGLNGNSFSFRGYPPINTKELVKFLRNLYKQAQKNSVQIFIETPHRNKKIVEVLLDKLPETTLLSIAFKLNYPEGFVKTKFLAQWKEYDLSFMGEKAPAVFLIGTNQYQFNEI